ncbi:hypothetical protein MTE01_19500 [Microbacterium testaceum]|uniref:Uncharacterized protein n=1 Tax=Microbacterium testaceum TaxID=2033 RepID=A0A4Y3QLB0_MICTE|nr:hypothetical protein [Microbacterium testaceum]GEB46005.1 hypothetical protein MTE01_19500 [Microbacterium testaceum]
MDDSVGDILLRWMSEIGSGTIEDLRARIEWMCRTVDIDLPPYASGRWLRDISSLGHCELDWDTGRWSIAPAAIVTLPGGDGLAVLAGERRLRILRALTDAEMWVEEARRASVEGEIPVPTTLFAPFSAADELVQIARVAGAIDAGLSCENIADALTPIEPRRPTGPPAYASELEVLDALFPRDWRTVSANQLNPPEGLYRERINGRWRHLTRRGGEWFDCDLSAGVFAELARRHESAIRWRSEPGRQAADIGTVFVDWGAPLPVLHRRALALCTGFPPRLGVVATTAIFENVPRSIAARVCTSLGQTLVVQ